MGKQHCTTRGEIIGMYKQKVQKQKQNSQKGASKNTERFTLWKNRIQRIANIQVFLYMYIQVRSCMETWPSYLINHFIFISFLSCFVDSCSWIWLSALQDFIAFISFFHFSCHTWFLLQKLLLVVTIGFLIIALFLYFHF